MNCLPYNKNILIEQGIEVVIANDAGVDIVNRIIYDELCLGKILEKSKAAYLDIIHELARNGAQGIILGCTEIGHPIPIFHSLIPHSFMRSRQHSNHLSDNKEIPFVRLTFGISFLLYRTRYSICNYSIMRDSTSATMGSVVTPSTSR